MGVKEEIKSYIVAKGWKIKDLVEEINKRHDKPQTVQNFSKKLNKETFRYEELKEIADILGYKIVWKDKEDSQ